MEKRSIMKVTCQNCRKTYNLREDRLPKGKKIAFACPACKARIRVDLRRDGGGKTTAVETRAPDPAVSTIGSLNRKPGGMALKFGLLRSLGDLPAMPDIIMRAQRVINDPDSNIKELVQMVEIEPAVATRVLKLANSAYYGMSGKVASVHHASVLLGYDALGEVIQVAGVSSFLSRSLQGYGFEAQVLWRHSLAVATGSKMIAKMRFPELENDAFTAGLIHDAGKMILDSHVYDNRDAFKTAMDNGQQTFLQAETSVFGFDHGDIAAEFCKKWNIPDKQTEAIQFHHFPFKAENNPLARILHAADWIAVENGFDLGEDSALYEGEKGVFDYLSLAEQDREALATSVQESVEQMSSGI